MKGIDQKEFKLRFIDRLLSAKQAGEQIGLPFAQTADLDAYLDALCEYFLVATPSERSELIQLFKNADALAFLHDYIPRITVRIKEPESKHRLLIGLAAVALTDACTDYRDTYYQLGYLFRAAQSAGIHDPMPEFLQVAQMLESHDDRSVGSLMMHLKESAVYRELRLFPTTDELACLIKQNDIIGLRNFILYGGDLNQRLEQDSTLLMLVAQTGNTKLLQLLIKAGAALDLVDANGNSALAHAALKEHWPVVKALIEAGANQQIQVAGLSFRNFLSDCLQQSDSKKLREVLKLVTPSER